MRWQVRPHPRTGTSPFRASIKLSYGGSFVPPTQGAPNQRDVWTSSKVLNDVCTVAVGAVRIGEDEVSGRSGSSC